MENPRQKQLGAKSQDCNGILLYFFNYLNATPVLVYIKSGLVSLGVFQAFQSLSIWESVASNKSKCLYYF